VSAAPDDTWIEEVVALDGLDVVLRRPPDAEALIDEEAFARDEALPYWAELWPAGVALARALRGRSLRGARVLELGCGLGLPGIVAALHGAHVLATDWSDDALAAARANAAANGARIATLRLDWREPAPAVERGPWDLVLAADVLYEARNVPVVLELLERLAAPVLLADPNRATAEPFYEQAAARFAVRRRRDAEPPHVSIAELRPR
jgi:predicted nicotinamide N-methyase